MDKRDRKWEVVGRCISSGTPIFALMGSPYIEVDLIRNKLAPPTVYRPCECKNTWGTQVRITPLAQPDVLKVMATAVTALLRYLGPEHVVIDEVQASACVEFLDKYIYGEAVDGKPLDAEGEQQNQVFGARGSVQTGG